jgi:uncharacterized DUF497 family protein
VSPRCKLHFEWNGAKALLNERKHRVRFMFDEEHSEAEESWIALGQASTSALLVVAHTWTEIDPVNVKVRMVSARKANAAEERVYQENL